jgi:hypothetical protein
MKDCLAFGMDCTRDLYNDFTSYPKGFQKTSSLISLLDEYRNVPEFATYTFATNEKVGMVFDAAVAASNLETLQQLPTTISEFINSYSYKNKFLTSSANKKEDRFEAKPLEQERVWAILKTMSCLNNCVSSIKTISCWFSISNTFVACITTMSFPLEALHTISSLAEEIDRLCTGIEHGITIDTKAAEEGKFEHTPFTKKHGLISVCIIITKVANLTFITMQFFLPSVKAAGLCIQTMSFFLSTIKSLIEKNITMDSSIQQLESTEVENTTSVNTEEKTTTNTTEKVELNQLC